MVDTTVAPVGFALLGLIGLLLIGGLVLVVTLLSKPKTQPAGVLLAVIGMAGIVGIGMLLFGARSVHVQSMHEAEMQALAKTEMLKQHAMELHRESLAEQGAILAPTTEDMKPEPAAPAASEAKPEDADADVEVETSQQPSDITASEESPPAAESKTVEEPGNEAGDPADAPAETDAAEPTGEQAPPPAESDANKDKSIGEVAQETAAPSETPADRATPAAAPPPAWVKESPGRVDDGYQMTIKLDPKPNRMECESPLSRALDSAVATYVRDVLKKPLRVARRVRLEPDYLRRNIVKEEWQEPVDIELPVDVASSDWVVLHVLLEFDHRANSVIESQCHRVIVAERLQIAGVGLASVLALLGVLFVCLKIDQQTKGGCRTRLGLGAIAITAVIAVAGLVVARFLQSPTNAPARPRPVELLPTGLPTGALPIGQTHSDEVAVEETAPAEGASATAHPAGAHVGFFAWALVIPAILLALAVIGGLVLLLANRKTRAPMVVTIVALGILVLVLHYFA